MRHKEAHPFICGFSEMRLANSYSGDLITHICIHVLVWTMLLDLLAKFVLNYKNLAVFSLFWVYL